MKSSWQKVQFLDSSRGHPGQGDTWSHLSAHPHNSGWKTISSHPSLFSISEHADPADPPPCLLHQGHWCLACHMCCLCLSQVFSWAWKKYTIQIIIEIRQQRQTRKKQKRMKNFHNLPSITSKGKWHICAASWSLPSSMPCLTFQRLEPGTSKANSALIGIIC